VNIRESLLFKKPCPSGEIWLRDSDIVLVPKSPILCADDVINLVFTRGIYGGLPNERFAEFRQTDVTVARHFRCSLRLARDMPRTFFAKTRDAT
jgi:hypothetical protein